MLHKNMKKTFWQFNIGHLITLISFVFSAGIFYGKYSADTNYTRNSLDKLTGQYESLNSRIYTLESFHKSGSGNWENNKHGSTGLMEK